MPVKISKGTCADQLEASLNDLNAWGQPIFANLDSWGNAPVPYKLLQRLAANVSSEVIVTLLPQHFVRFVSDLGKAGDEVFGGNSHWRTVTDLAPEAKSRHILTCYRQALRSAGYRVKVRSVGGLRASMYNAFAESGVEALVQLSNRDDIHDLITLLDRYMDPGTASWHLDNRGVWTRRHKDENGNPLSDVQSWLLASRSRQRAALRR